MRLGLAFFAWCLHAHVAANYWSTNVLVLNPVDSLQPSIDEAVDMIDHTDTRTSNIERGKFGRTAYTRWYLGPIKRRGTIADVTKSVAFKKDVIDIFDRDTDIPSDKDSSKSKLPVKNSYLLDLIAAKSKRKFEATPVRYTLVW